MVVSFGSVDHGWLLRFVQHRVGDPRLVSLIRRWLTAGVLEDGGSEASEEGVPQGGSISVVLSNLYLHYVLDLGVERVVKPRLQGQAYLIRYIDDCVGCFQHQADARRCQQGLSKRQAQFALALAPSKTRWVAFGRFAERQAKAQGKRPATCTLLGFTQYCTRNHRGNFKVGGKTEATGGRCAVAVARKALCAGTCSKELSTRIRYSIQSSVCPMRG